MIRFFLKLLLVFIPIAILIFILLFSLDGYSDYFYLRFTTPRQSSLILGTSRASQGVLPQVLDSCLRRHDFFNYSFTRNTSPYGPTYFSSIKKKLDTRTKNGVFILVIDAWGLCSDTPDPNDVAHFEELKGCLAYTKEVDVDPNFDYLLYSYSGPYIKLLKKDKSVLLHDNGWLEVSVDMNTVDQLENIKTKIGIYRKEILPFYKFSTVRYGYLQQTVKYLKRFGKVYLVRLPTHPQMMALDQELVPNLDELVGNLSSQYHVPYLNLSSKNSAYQYIDGNHLYKHSGKQVTLEIANWILNQKPKP